MTEDTPEKPSQKPQKDQPPEKSNKKALKTKKPKIKKSKTKKSGAKKTVKKEKVTKPCKASWLMSIFLILGILLMCLMAAFLVRMQKGPIDLTFAKPQIEQALSYSANSSANGASGHYDVLISKAELTWPNILAPILIETHGVQINQKDITALSVDKVSLGLSGLNLLKGKILPSKIIIDGPTFQLKREDGSFNLFWQDENFPEEEIDEEEIKERDIDQDISQDIVQNINQDTKKVTKDESDDSLHEDMDEDVLENALSTLHQEIFDDIFDFGEIEAERFGDAESDEDFDDTALTVTEEDAPPTPKQMRKSAKEFLAHITNPENSEIDALSALRVIELKNAVIMAPNNMTQDYLALMDVSLRKNRQGLKGELRVTLPKENGEAALLKSDILYRRDQQDVTFMAEVVDINPESFAALFPQQKLLQDQNMPLSGMVEAVFNQEFQLKEARSNLSIAAGKLNVPDVYDDLDIKDAVFEAAYSRAQGVLAINRFDAVTAGIPIKLKAQGRIDQEGLHLPLVASIDKVPMNDIENLLPLTEKNTSFSEWLSVKLRDGILSNIIFTADVKIGALKTVEIGSNKGSLKDQIDTPPPREVDFSNSKMTFDFDGLTIKYSDTLTPVTKARGKTIFEKDSLKITGDAGNIKDMIGRNISVILTDLSVAGAGYAKISLDASGPMATVFDYVSDEPLNMAKTLDFDLQAVKGQVDFNLQLSFPTLKDLPKEQVKLVLDGKVNNLVLPKVVQGLPLTGGPYDLAFKDGRISLKGQGQLAGRPIDVSWVDNVDMTGRDFSSRVTAKLTADDELRRIFGIGLEEYLSGPVPIDVTYTDFGKKSTIDVKGVLTPATITIAPFQYKKLPASSANISFKAYMEGETLKEIDNLNLSAPNLLFGRGRLIFKKLSNGETDVARGNIPEFVLGKTNVAADFEVMPNNTLKIIANGAVVDATPFFESNSEGAVQKKTPQPQSGVEQPLQLSISATKMLTPKNNSLRNVKLYMDRDAKNGVKQIELDADVGKGAMFVRFKPEGNTGKRTFKLESTDAGASLKVFDVTDKVVGGSMTVYGQPRGGDTKGDLFGKAKIENFRVRKAPSLAKLLNALSLSGMQDLLNNDGLVFEKLESDFQWQFREESDLLIVENGRTSGASLGLTFEGVINNSAKTTDISGTIIPLSGLNRTLGEIPVLGQLLTGGKALIAATYKMSGSAGDPKVSVNPLSVLAPGFLRRLLFEESIESKMRKEGAKMEEDATDTQSKPSLPSAVINSTKKNFNLKEKTQ